MGKYDSTTSDVDLYANVANGRIRLHPKIQLLGPAYGLCDLYLKGSNLIIKYTDGATTRYKYLDLSGTGTTWFRSTSEP